MREPARLRMAAGMALPVAGAGAAVGLGTLPPAALFAVALMAAHAVTIPDRTGRRLSLSPMVAVAALLLADGRLAVVLPGAAIGVPPGWWLVRTMRGARSLDHLLPGEMVALAASACAYAAAHPLTTSGGPLHDVGHAVAIGVAAFVWYATAVLVRVPASGRRRLTRARVLWWEALRDGPAYLALFSAGAMFGFAWGAMSWWAFPLALLPYGFSHLSLQRLAATRRTYRQTMTALARIPEAGGQAGHGSAERTGRLAAAVAAEIRLAPSEVERVEYAGLLHDIGRVVLNDPDVAAAGYSDSDVAAWGAAIIEESPYLARVGMLVADQCKPYRRAGEARNELVPRSAQVVGVCGTYDRWVAEQGKTPVEALEELHRGAAYDYDPEVVAALRRVLQRRGVPGA